MSSEKHECYCSEEFVITLANAHGMVNYEFFRYKRCDICGKYLGDRINKESKQ